MNERKRCETCGSQYDIETGCECPISPSTTTVRVTGPNGPFTVPDSLPGHAMAHGKQELRAHSGLGSGALREALAGLVAELQALADRTYAPGGPGHEEFEKGLRTAYLLAAGRVQKLDAALSLSSPIEPPKGESCEDEHRSALPVSFVDSITNAESGSGVRIRSANDTTGNPLLLLPDTEWSSLSSDSQRKIQKWFELATAHLEQMLRPTPQASSEIREALGKIVDEYDKYLAGPERLPTVGLIEAIAYGGELLSPSRQGAGGEMKKCRKWMKGFWCIVRCCLELDHEGDCDLRPRRAKS